MTPRVRRLAGPVCAVLLLGSLSGCGDTLVDHRNLKIRDLVNGPVCDGPDKLVCDVAGTPTCKTQGVGPDAVCGSGCQPCLASSAPANATAACSLTPAGTDRFCDFTCAPGYLKTATTCSQPKLVAAGDQFSCATAFDTGEVYCWGFNGSGQVGSSAPGTAAFRATRVPAAALVDVLALAAGPSHACAIVAGAPTKKTYCWGDANGFGGNQSSVSPVEVPALAGMDHLAAGGGHTCGWTDAGDFACAGPLGAGGGAPVLGPAGSIIELAAGHFFTCALVSDSAAHSIKCWGQNDKGQLGDLGAGGNSSTPRTIGFPVAEPAGLVLGHVAGGAAHACATTNQDGKAAPSVFCWGDNSNHQAGLVTAAVVGPTWIDRMNKPISNTAPTAIEAGGITTCVTKNDVSDVLSCWGADSVAAGGVLPAPGERVDLTSLSPPGLFAMGADHGCIANRAAGADLGKLLCWGHGAQGQLGDGLQADSMSPVLVVSQ